jgi:predicted lipid-binding transport protein (Tim44 family)
LDIFVAVVFLALVVFFFYMYARLRGKAGPTISRPAMSAAPYQGPPPAPDQGALEAAIKERDPNFDAYELKGWVKELFLALNKAWTARDWQRVRIFETNSLFNEHNQLLEQYRKDKRINMIEQIGIREVDLRSYRFDERFEYLEVSIHAQLIDYVIDEQTKLVVAGSSAQIVHMFYTLIFKRTAGAQSKDSLLDVGETNCPNCGAPLQITVAGQCEYCGTIVMADEYSWALDQFTGKRL